MKKFLCIMLVLVLLVSMAACANRNNNTATPGTGTNITYKDGTFTGAGDPWKYGSEDATVAIKDGKITNITLRRLETTGKEVNYDDWTGKTVDEKTRPNLKQFRLDMAGRMLEKQTYNVDTISSATVSTGNWKLAVQRALQKAVK